LKLIRKFKFFILIIVLVIPIYGLLRLWYEHDITKPEPRIWQGALDYRINFRDVGKSLNSCLGKDEFATGKLFRANKNFSGWNCQKIGNPDKIYSLNFNVKNPQRYYCIDENDQRQFGTAYNDTFTIGTESITDLSSWKSKPYRQTMCSFFKNALLDLSAQQSLLAHCDLGRDRTGAFTAILTYMLLEAQNLNSLKMQDAIECDFEKTTALSKDQYGLMKSFLTEMENKGGVKSFIQSQCSISDELILSASQNFIKPK